MLTLDEFNEIKEGDVFVKGEIPNSPIGLYMENTNIGKMIKWVAVKGYANDWCIYCGWAERGYDDIKNTGDKVFIKDNIQRLVPCDNEVLRMYRY